MKSGQLQSLTTIKISGEDAMAFLQGQLTNNVNELDKNWQLSGYCNPKGRLLTLLQLWREKEDVFYALLSKDLSQIICNRLRMYVMRSKVLIEELDQQAIYGFASIDDLLATRPELTSTVEPHTQNQVIQSKAGTALIINQRAIYVGDNIDHDSELTNFDDQWTQFNIEQGLPHIINASSELFIPQMVNLDLLGGINFKKGCYTGQEIVARMHYLGKLKQRMFVCDLTDEFDNAKTGDKIARAGDKIVVEDFSSAGHIVLATQSCAHCLAVLKLDRSNDALFLENGIKLKKREIQPYSI